MKHSRKWYEQTLRSWLEGIEGLWNEAKGHYEAAGSAAPYFDAKLIVPLTLFALKGDEWARGRIRSIVGRMLQSPPWDEAERLWNNNYERLGFPPHGANAPIDSGLSFAVRYAREIGIPDQEAVALRHRMTLSLQRWAESGEGAEEYDHQVFLDRDGRTMDLSAAFRKALEPEATMDLSWVRERGPANQVCFQMRAALHAYLAAGDEVFLQDMEKLWNRVLPADGASPSEALKPRPGIFDEDWSFRYSSNPLHCYEMSVYDLPMLGMFGDVIRILRALGRKSARREQFYSRWCHAALTRAELLDGSTNMVFDLYGRDRISPDENYGQSSVWLHSLVSLADLTPLPREELKFLFDIGIERFRRWGFTRMAPDIGLEGWQESSGLDDLCWVAYEVALMLLTNEEVLSVGSSRPLRSTAGFAWKEKYFVRQTPSYHLTVVGTSPGYDGKWGIPCSGGEYILRVPFGDYLIPISDGGRTTLSVRIAGAVASSRDITLAEAEAGRSARVLVSTPAVGELERGRAYMMPVCDLSCEEADCTVSWHGPGFIVRRSFTCRVDRVVIVDSLTAEQDIEVDEAVTQFPIMTRNPRSEASRPIGLAEDLLAQSHGAQKSLLTKGRSIGFRFTHYGLSLTQKSGGETSLRIGEEWHESNTINCILRNVDCLWIPRPTTLRAGEEQSWEYELEPLSDGHEL